jgi:hypothetical protein
MAFLPLHPGPALFNHPAITGSTARAHSYTAYQQNYKHYYQSFNGVPFNSHTIFILLERKNEA